jgi:hypothetical protein
MPAAFGAAGVALAAFGAAAGPQLSGVTKASEAFTKAEDAVAKYGAGSKQAAEANKAYQQSLAGLPPATRQTATAFIALKTEHKAWSESLSGDTMPVFTKGINAARAVLPKLTPLVKTAARELNVFMDGILAGARGGGFDAWVKKINKVAGPVLGSFLRSVKNVGRGVLGIFDAFLPHAPAMSRGIEGLTAKFAAWGQGLKSSEGFRTFIDYVRQHLPALSTTFGNLVRIVVNLATAFAPLSGISLQIITGFTGILAALPPPLLTALVGGFVALTMALRILIPIQTALNLVMSANPIGLVVLAIAGLVAGLVVAYKRSETFRNIVNGAWLGIQTVVGAAWRTVIRPALEGLGNLLQRGYQTWQTTWPKLQGLLNEVVQFWDGVFIGAIARVGDAFSGLGGKADQAGGKIAGIGKGFQDTQTKGDGFSSWASVWGAGIGTIMLGPLGTILGGITGWFWPQTKKGFTDGFNWLSNNWRGLGAGMVRTQVEWTNKVVFGSQNFIKRVKNAIFGGLPPIRRDWSSLWNWIQAFATRLANLTVEVFRRFMSRNRTAFANGVDSIGRAWRKLQDVAKAPVNFVIGLHNSGIVPLVNGLAGLVGNPKRLGKLPKFAGGGVLPGYAPGRDSLVAAVSPGESIFRPEFTRAVGPGWVGAANAMARRGVGTVRRWLTGPDALGGEGMAFARGGVVPGFAGGFDLGGIVGGFVKGVRDFLVGDPFAGAKRLLDRVLGARVPGSGGLRDVIAGIPNWLKTNVLKWIKDKVSNFGGGPGISRALAFARAQAGKPYVWGGVGPRGYDCSGFMSALTNVIKGRSPYSRLFTTHSFGSSSGPGGFVRGARSGFTVGVTDAGVGHMAGTLAGKVNVESRGSRGVVVGPGARGTGDGLFSRKYGLKMDTGGMLMPGWNPPIYNGTGAPEPVLTPAQFDALAGGGRDITLNLGPIYLSEQVDIDMLWQQLEFRIKAAAL